MKKENGITLVALVISIIVLLILATVSIQVLTGDNGLLQKATTAKKANEEAKELELIKLAVSAAQVAGEGKLNTTNLKNELEKNLNDNDIDNNLKPISDYWNYKGYKIDNNGNVERLLLPAEYQQVEYIESTGTQFINTEIYPKSSTKVFFDFRCTEYVNDAFNGWDSDYYDEIFAWGTYNNKFNSIIDNSWRNNERGYSNIAFNLERHQFYLESGKQQLDNDVYATTRIKNTASSNQYLYLFAMHCEWTNSRGDYSKRCRLFL